MSIEQRVLVVDDEPHNTSLLSALLNKEGYAVSVAADGTEAMQLAFNESPDIILLDIMMPGLDGFEVTRQLKANYSTRNIPVVLVSSLDGNDNRVTGLDAGADEFLNKPVNRAELLCKVRNLLRVRQLQNELNDCKQIELPLENINLSDAPDQTLILVVDDDVRLSKHIVDILQSEGYHSRAVASCESARKMVQHRLPDLVLLDRILPDGDGLALMDEWKTDERLKTVPIIITTSLTDLTCKIEGIEHEADDYLIKPVEGKELLARVRAGLRRAFDQKKLQLDIERLKVDSVTDWLTGVRNRHYLNADLEHRHYQSMRNPQRSFSILMLDIDNFKQVNDRYGHIIGDMVLRQIAQLLQKMARTSDIVTRYGGEEFCIVLPETDQQEAYIIAERLHLAIAEFQMDGVYDRSVTVSLGVATFCTEDNRVNDLLLRADTALYQAKETGRNRVCMAIESQNSAAQERTG